MDDNRKGKVADAAGKVANAAKKVIIKTKDTVTGLLDQNNDGQIDIQDIITLAIKTPGVHITRSTFLQKELFKNHPQEVIDDAISRTPALAGISSEEIHDIADQVIRY